MEDSRSKKRPSWVPRAAGRPGGRLGSSLFGGETRSMASASCPPGFPNLAGARGCHLPNPMGGRSRSTWRGARGAPRAAHTDWRLHQTLSTPQCRTQAARGCGAATRRPALFRVAWWGPELDARRTPSAPSQHGHMVKNNQYLQVADSKCMCIALMLVTWHT